MLLYYRRNPNYRGSYFETLYTKELRVKLKRVARQFKQDYENGFESSCRATINELIELKQRFDSSTIESNMVGLYINNMQRDFDLKFSRRTYLSEVSIPKSKLGKGLFLTAAAVIIVAGVCEICRD